MSQRFISNVALAVAGAFGIVASQTLATSTTGWIVFGISLGALALLGVMQRDRARGNVQGLLDAGTGALALWSAIASVVYTGTTLKWLSFGEAAGYVGLGILGLIILEVKTERVVQAYGATRADRRDGDRAEELQAAA